jgi:putative transcriptional regulator
MIHHHPSEATVLAYAAGTLPEPHARVLAVHAARCPQCRAALRRAESLGGALLEALPGAPLAPDAVARALGRLDEPAPPEPAPVVPPTTLTALATRRWRWTGPGISMMNLMPRDPTGTRLDLIRVEPGTALLQHSHHALETTSVLQGAFDDGTGTYCEGDFAEGGATLDHQPRTLPGEACICLIATTGRLRPRGLLGRLVRPLIGM